MIWFKTGSLVMFLAVALGAFGAHALKGSLTEEGKTLWQTAVLYHLVHGLGLLAVGWLATLKPMDSLIPKAGWAFVLGIVVFSGSLYLLSLTGVKRWGAVTPIGGLCLLAGWLFLAWAARR